MLPRFLIIARDYKLGKSSVFNTCCFNHKISFEVVSLHILMDMILSSKIEATVVHNFFPGVHKAPLLSGCSSIICSYNIIESHLTGKIAMRAIF